MKAIVISPTQLPTVVDIDGTYESLRDLIGGYLEALPFTEGSSVYIDEEGKLKGLPPNLIATSLMRSIGPGLWPDDSICGTMVIVGNNDVNGEYDGEEHDVPDAVIKQVMEFKL